MAVLKGYIKSAGLSRTISQMTAYSFVTISAFRKYDIDAFKLFKKELKGVEDKNEWLDANPEAQKFLIPHSENMKRHRAMMLKIRSYDIFAYQIMGQYPEGGSTRKEVSLFCFADKSKADSFRDIMVDIAHEYEQDSICFCEGADIETATDSKGQLIERKIKANIYEIATSPKDINAKGVSVGTKISKFSGVSIGSLVTGEIDSNGAQILQDIFSKVKDRPYYWLGWEPVMTPNPRIKGCHCAGNIARVLSKESYKQDGCYSTGDYAWVKAWVDGKLKLPEVYAIKGTERWRYGSVSKIF